MCKKCLYSELFWSTFSAFGLNTDRYGVSLRIQSECGKMRTKITPNMGTFYAVFILNDQNLNVTPLVTKNTF